VTTTPKIVWRNALLLCAAAAVMVLVSSCRAPAPEVGRYQWVIVPQGEGRQDQIYVIDTVTGEVAERSGSSWRPSYMAPLSTPDWTDIRKQRAEKQQQAEEAREKKIALTKAYGQMPLGKQVAWAKDISVCRRRATRYFLPGKPIRAGSEESFGLEIVERLKGGRGSFATMRSLQPYKATDEGLVVWFNGEADGGSLEFGLSGTPVDSKQIFPAPATIIDDVKAEIKRQEEKQKEAHAENH